MLDRAKESLLHYSQEGYLSINGCLRQTDPCSSETLDHIANIDTLFQSAPTPHDIVGFRGISPVEAGSFARKGVKAGTIITRPCFTSLSDKATIGKIHSWMKGAGLVLRVLVPAGTRAFNVNGHSAHPWEAELLLPRGTRFRFLRDLDALPYVDIEVIQEDQVIPIAAYG